MKYYSYKLLILFAVISLLSGCRQNKNGDEDYAQHDTMTAPVIRNLSAAMLRKILTERNGKILLVNLWSTWSEKSMSQLSDFKELYKDYSNTADFLIINIDLSTAVEPKVLPFLKKNKINFPVYLIDANEGKTIMKMLNPGWAGNIPVTYIYDKTGNQKTILQGIQSGNELKENIKNIIN